MPLLLGGSNEAEVGQAAIRHSDIKLTMGIYTDPMRLGVEDWHGDLRIHDKAGSPAKSPVNRPSALERAMGFGPTTLTLGK